jgi:hypothetical protein
MNGTKGTLNTQLPQPDNKNAGMLTLAQRRAGLVSAFLMLVLLGFFLYHQVTNTGFFTDEFKWPEMLALYVPILISMVPPIQRFIEGRRDSGLAMEAVTDLSLAIGSLVLWIVFPFDFTHLADPLPANAQLMFSWINNTVGRLILLVQVIIGTLSGLARLRDYRRHIRTNSSESAPGG